MEIETKRLHKHLNALENVSFRFLVENICHANIRNTSHFREWFRTPMNYVRQMELPVTMELLSPKQNDTILDVSSPKLLALFYSRMGFNNVIASDRDDYFIGDFNQYIELLDLDMKTSVFDIVKGAPFPDNHFDKIYSISVIEHIEDNDDRKAMSELMRVLKPGGRLVITVPAWNEHIEEWLRNKHFYWDTVQNEKGFSFYQRRYTADSIRQRLEVGGGSIDKLVFIAETPIREAYVNNNGMFMHNCYFLEKTIMGTLARSMTRIKIPWSSYFVHKTASRRHHYLTNDVNDPNIRQAAVLFIKDS